MKDNEIRNPDDLKMTLAYNPMTKRYGVICDERWVDKGLHCGETLFVKQNNEWIPDRLELSDDWYLVYTKLKGKELENLEVKFREVNYSF